MGLLKLSSILKPGAKLRAFKINARDPEVRRLIRHTTNEQRNILKLKYQVDYQRLRNTLVVI